MGLIRWIFSIGILSIWCALIGTALYVALYESGSEAVSGDVIVVLGGNANSSGALNPATQQRMTTAIALFEQDAAPQIVMTGGQGVGEAMRNAAIAAGIPNEVILVEGAAKSTLQNALFTADLAGVDQEDAILLVTQRYHLPRANASFRWAGFDNITNVAADPEGGLQFSQELLWEAVKWPFNVLRAAAASAADAGDVPRESYIQYLE